MIIQALNDYYNLLLEDPDVEDIPKPGYSVAKANFIATISKEGELLDITPLGDDKKDWKEVLVPEQKKRAGRNPPPYFMCENCKFVFGWDFNKKGNKIKNEYYNSFKELHEEILSAVNNEKSIALLNFLRKWNLDKGLSNVVIKENIELLENSTSCNIIFKLDCEAGYLHQDSEILKAWEEYLSSREDNPKGQCLVTGENVTIAKIHPAIKGVRGAQSAGGAIVS
ncbi:MAG: type I-C CRISPR-associated protein Cas8c/Csd1, partial [bacterium]